MVGDLTSNLVSTAFTGDWDDLGAASLDVLYESSGAVLGSVVDEFVDGEIGDLAADLTENMTNTLLTGASTGDWTDIGQDLAMDFTDGGTELVGSLVGDALGEGYGDYTEQFIIDAGNAALTAYATDDYSTVGDDILMSGIVNGLGAVSYGLSGGEGYVAPGSEPAPATV